MNNKGITNTGLLITSACTLVLVIVAFTMAYKNGFFSFLYSANNSDTAQTQPIKINEDVNHVSQLAYFTSDKFKRVTDVQLYGLMAQGHQWETYEVMFEVVDPASKVPIRETLRAEKCLSCTNDKSDDFDRIKGWHLSVNDKVRFMKVDPYHKHQCIINNIELRKRYSGSSDDPEITNP